MCSSVISAAQPSTDIPSHGSTIRAKHIRTALQVKRSAYFSSPRRWARTRPKRRPAPNPFVFICAILLLFLSAVTNVTVAMPDQKATVISGAVV
jgi:hypothetical protein